MGLSGRNGGHGLESQDTVSQESLEGIGEGEVEDDLALENLDASPDFQDSKTDGVELRAGQLGAFEGSGTERVHENVPGAVEEKPKLVRLKPVTTGAIGVEVAFVLLACPLGLGQGSSIPRPHASSRASRKEAWGAPKYW